MRGGRIFVPQIRCDGVLMHGRLMISISYLSYAIREIGTDPSHIQVQIGHMALAASKTGSAFVINCNSYPNAGRQDIRASNKM
jgi:hypothetical protein